MRLSNKIDRVLVLITILMLGLVFANFLRSITSNVYAEGEDRDLIYESDEHYVIFYDDGEKLSVKTDAKTVAEALNRADISIGAYDSVEPGLDDEINSDNFFINIYRAHPAVINDGTTSRYLMTSSYDGKTVFNNAGIVVYDGDEIFQTVNDKFLETGAAISYTINRHGGETVTVEEEIPFSEQRNTDYSLAYGQNEVVQVGENGRKEVVYKIKTVNGVEVSRELISETVIAEPVDRIVSIGALLQTSTTASENETIAWNYLIGQGFTKEQVAGIMGNLQQEHHFETSDVAGGLGIAQWTGGRRENLLAKSDPYSIYVQLDYLMEELNGRYSYAKNSILNSATIEEATRAFQNKFEACGICRESLRISYAYEIYERYKDD